MCRGWKFRNFSLFELHSPNYVLRLCCQCVGRLFCAGKLAQAFLLRLYRPDCAERRGYCAGVVSGLVGRASRDFFSEFGCLQALLYLQRAEHVAQGLGLVAFRVEAVFYCGDSGVLHMAQRRDSFAFDACRHCF